MRRTEYMVGQCDPKSLTVQQIMQDVVVSCRPHTTGLELARLLTEWNIGSSLPVVEDNKTLIGLVSESDLLDAILEGTDLHHVTSEDLMSREQLVTVTEDKSILDLADLFQNRYLNRMPVVLRNTLVDIVARRDIVCGYSKALANYWP